MLQMEDVIAADEVTPEVPADEYVYDYIDNTKDDEIDEREEVKAYSTKFEQSSAELRNTAILSREKAHCIINEIFTGVVSDEDF
jgi:hypothetical protein